MKTMRHVLLAAFAGCGLALATATAMSTWPTPCSQDATIRDWAALETGCDIGDKNWTLNTEDESLLSATIAFGFIGSTYAMQITGFDLSDAAGAWELDYTISVLDPRSTSAQCWPAPTIPAAERPASGHRC